MRAALVALSTGGALSVAALISLFAARLAGVTQNWRAVAFNGGIGIVMTVLAWVTGLTGILPVFLAPVAALGGMFAIVVTLHQRGNGDGAVSSTVFAGILTLLVYVPVVSLVFALWYDPLATGIGLLDLGAALPTEVAAGSATLAVVFLRRRDEKIPRRQPARGASLIPLGMGLVVAWIAWLMGLELAIDSLTPLIVGNSILMALSGALAWALVERARFQTNTVTGTVLGLLAGLAAATPAAGYVEPALAVITALLAGAFAALMSGRVALTAPRRISGVLLVGGGTSLALLGFFAKDVGLVYTGQPELFLGQLLSILGGGAAGFAAGLVATIITRHLQHPRTKK